MGKNKRAKQVVNATEIDLQRDASNEVPEEFLTSDDFQVVVQKKRHCKKSNDESETLPRSNRFYRSIYTELADEEAAHSCHSGFWSIRMPSEDMDFETATQNGSLPVEKDSKPQLQMEKAQTKKELVVKENIGDGLANGDFRQNNANEPETPDSGISCCSLINTFDNLTLEIDKGSVEHHMNRLSLKSSDLNTELESVKACPNDVNQFKRQDDSILDLHSNGNSLGEVFDKVDEENDNCPFPTISGDKESHKSDILINRESNKDMSQKVIPKTEAQTKKDKKSKKKQKGAMHLEIGYLKTKCSSNEPLIKSRYDSPTFESANDLFSKNEEMEKTKKKDQEKKDRKRPSKSQLAAIHEALKKAKEEEEKRKVEEETQLKQAEKAEQLRQEIIRREQDKKEKKKLKEKEKKQKMKAEGKLLSKSQKQSRARMEATLQVLRQRGIDVPQIGEKRERGPRLGNYKSTYRKRTLSGMSDQGEKPVSRSERFKSESLSSQESGKESLSDLPSSFDSKDSWDVASLINLALGTESEAGRFSFSEDSDVLDEDSTSPSAKTIADNLKESVENLNLARMKTGASVKAVEENPTKLRSPVICVLGHVDTGKTKILDFIRKTHVQDGEAGGITQQIGATMIPRDALKEKCKMVKDISSLEMQVPGLLVIDTPGHESFSNLRSRGTSICDIAILVVDIMHGLEAQTIESINLLKTSKIPFVVALNKIDRLYGWKSSKDEDIEYVINSQSHATLMELKTRCQDIVLQFANQCLNAVLFYENTDPRTYVSMVPTSAITGDGMGNILSLVTQLTQSLMHKRLIFSEELEATVLEVKVIPGLGTTIDVILVNGDLHEGDTIVLAGHDGPIVTQIRSLLMPHSLKELRVKNTYTDYKTIGGAQGVKITGKDLDKCIAGMPVLVAKNHTKVDALKAEMSQLLCQSVNFIKKSEHGIFVQASTLGSLEALLGYLTTLDVPYFGVKIGPVVKKDVMKASIMLEHDTQYAAILAFDVKVERDAQEFADSLGVKIFHADIIYHLFDQFVQHRDDILKKREGVKHLAVFPCILSIVHDPICIKEFMIVLRVKVETGFLRKGTPLCVPSKGNIDVGFVSNIKTHDEVMCAKVGQVVTVTIEVKEGDLPKIYGQDFDHEDYLVSRLTRQSIDVCREHYNDDVDWDLMAELKRMLHV